MSGFRWRKAHRHILQVPPWLYTLLVVLAAMGLIVPAFFSAWFEPALPGWFKGCFAASAGACWLAVMLVEPAEERSDGQHPSGDEIEP